MSTVERREQEAEAISRCPRWRLCSANVCPLDPNLEKRSWFPDEDICNSSKFQKHPVVVAQKWIQKRWEKGQKAVKICGKVKQLHSQEEPEGWLGAELQEVGEYLLEKRKERSEKMKSLIADGLHPLSETCKS